MPALLTRMSSRPWRSRTSLTVRSQSSGLPMLPWCVEVSISALARSAQRRSAASESRLWPAAMFAPWIASARQIAAPMPRVPPVTRATRPSSLLPARSTFWLSCVVAIPFSPLSPPAAWGCCSPATRALAEPLGEVGPDLLARPRAGHQADVAAGPVEVRDILAADHVEQRERALARRDVVRARGDDEHVLIDLAQVDP